MFQATENHHCQEQESLVREAISVPQVGPVMEGLVIHPENSPSDEAEDPTGDYLAKLQSQSQPQPLSMETLKAVWDALESRELMNEDLRGCFERALEKFPREPPCVQRSARMVIKSNNSELIFLSGKGECKIMISDSGAGYKVEEPTAQVYLARLCSQPQPLTIKTLQGVQDELESRELLDEDLRGCFERALEKFPQEPPCVQRSARMVIKSNNSELTFLSGKGECKIMISGNGPCYEVEEPTARVYLARLHSCPPELSIQTLQSVRDALEKWKLPDKKLEACIKLALAEFLREPPCVQDNARLVIKHKNKEIVFESGQKECEITVSEGSTVKLESWAPYWECLRHSAEPLSMEILERVHNKANNGKAPEGVRNILKVAVRDFFAEPSCLQENARLVIECDEGELVFVSGKGENKVKVCIIDGKITYSVAANNRVTFCRACMKLLSELYQGLQKYVHDVDKVFQFLQYFHIFKEIGKAIIPYLLKTLA